MSDKVKLTSMAIREMLMDYYKGDSGMQFAKNRYVNWNPVGEAGRQYNYRQTRRNIQDPRALVFGNKCILVVGRNPDTAKFCVDTFRGNAIMQEIQRDMEGVFQKYLKGVKVKYDGKGEPVSAKEAKDWCEKAKYIDQFEQPEGPFSIELDHMYGQVMTRPIRWTTMTTTSVNLAEAWGATAAERYGVGEVDTDDE